MMKVCMVMGCRQWAQWAALYPDNGPLRLFCTTHRNDEAKTDNEESIKFLFVGAIPNAVDTSKYRPYFQTKPKAGRNFVEGADVRESGDGQPHGKPGDTTVVRFPGQPEVTIKKGFRH